MRSQTDTVPESASNPQTFSAIDIHFSELMGRLDGASGTEIIAAAALASFAVRAGNSFVELADFAGSRVTIDGLSSWSEQTWPELKPWIARLESSGVVGKPGDYRPLIIDSTRLYLYRYHDYEFRLGENLRARAQKYFENPDIPKFREKLLQLFPDRSETDWQRIAATTAMLKHFSVITGGPGTGKTTTVARLLALLIEMSSPKRLRIALAAPTGKAAMRLKESLIAAIPGLACAPETKAALPLSASTLHRLLGSIPDSPYFRHSEKLPLPYDVIVVDEASMVDLALMAKLVDAVPAASRLILLGDRDQLASVEAGAVLGDICNTGTDHRFSEDHAQRLAELIPDFFQHEPTMPPIADSIAPLRKSYRFNEQSGIAKLSRAVNNGVAAEVAEVLSGSSNDLIWKNSAHDKELGARLAGIVEEYFATYFAEADPGEAMALFNRFRILCALRGGDTGVERVNELIESMLISKGLIKSSAAMYHGKPIMVTRNDYSLNLFNGDTGLIFRDPKDQSSLKAYFPGQNGVRAILPRLLPSHETVFAMTVHKAQGSEFDHALLIFPSIHVPVLTRELLYTAITRARKSIEIWADPALLACTVETRITRRSGLREMLWGGEALI